MKYQQSSFSVGYGGNRAYRDNHERAFRKAGQLGVARCRHPYIMKFGDAEEERAMFRVTKARWDGDGWVYVSRTYCTTGDVEQQAQQLVDEAVAAGARIYPIEEFRNEV